MSMIYDSYHQHIHKPGDPIPPAKTRWIWKVFWILLAVTSVEVVVAFSAFENWWGFSAEQQRSFFHGFKVLYILLTLVKAYYIIFSYMHLGDERKNFKLTLGALIVILAYFIVLMMIEGYYQDTIHFDFPAFMQRDPLGIDGAHH